MLNLEDSAKRVLFCSHAKTFFLPRCQWKTSEPPEGRKSIKIIAIFLLNEVFPRIQKRVSNFESCLHLTAFDPLHASWNIGIFTGFTDLNGASSPFRIVRIIWSWRCWHCQVLPGTARMWRCCGAKVATKLPVPVRIPSFRAMASWQPGDSNQNEARLSRFVLSLVFYGFVMFWRFFSQVKRKERRTYRHIYDTSRHIFHHI